MKSKGITKLGDNTEYEDTGAHKKHGAARQRWTKKWSRKYRDLNIQNPKVKNLTFHVEKSGQKKKKLSPKERRGHKYSYMRKEHQEGPCAKRKIRKENGERMSTA